ncbi:MAG: hypothetical protein EXR93_11615 [Gemmatimonadetes bacterium]|nr:hypothetical protein [Gemmatimonadota bacterium]
MHKLLLAAGVAAAIMACDLRGTNDPIPLTKITKMQAFLCVVPNAPVCLGRGATIPAGQNPPRTEAFQVWAWHPGYNTTAWRIFWSDRVSDPASILIGSDSVLQPITLEDLPDSIKTVGVRAYILGQTGKDTTVLYKDSLMWTYP